MLTASDVPKTARHRSSGSKPGHRLTYKSETSAQEDLARRKEGSHGSIVQRSVQSE